MNAFERLHPALQHHIVNSLGWRELREVQSLSIDAFLAGANLVILAPTAGGKTESAFFPVISQMLTEGWDGLSVLYVSPIRALLNNQEQRLQNYFSLGRTASRLLARRHDSGRTKRRILADPPDCLLTTPESLEAILVSTKIDHREFFKNVQAVVIDELHAFAGDDRGWHLLSVFSRIQRLAGVICNGSVCPRPSATRPRCWRGFRPGRSENGKSFHRNPSTRQSPDVQLDYVGSLAECGQGDLALASRAKSGSCSATADPESNNWLCCCGSGRSIRSFRTVRSGLRSVGQRKTPSLRSRTA